MDLLGQKEWLKQWCTLPQSLEEREAFNQGLTKTVGPVSFLRDKFQEIFNTYLTPIDPNELNRLGLTREQASAWLKAENATLGWGFFSDSFVFWSPTQNAQGDLTVRGFYIMLLASAIMMPLCLVNKTPLRGGIEVGVATELPPRNDIYGPAVAEAYGLESKVAQYPRIVVGKALREYIEAVKKSGGRDEYSSVMRKMAEECSLLICEDCDDGVPMLDFLGEAMFSFYRERRATKSLDTVRKAIAYVKEEHDRLKREGDPKMAMRYGRLRAYCSSREHLWRE
jgi:hypothetical protein